MSLTHQFFIEHDAAQVKWEKLGEQELGNFLALHSISLKKLIQANLLEYKNIQSTTDIIDYQVTKNGAAYLHELRRLQLVFVKKNKIAELLSLLV